MEVKRPHVVLIPYPAQGHINPMMQLAKLLHSRGFFITFVNTESIHTRLLISSGDNIDSLECLDDFRFETILDGKPPSTGEAVKDAQAFCESVQENCAAPFRNLLRKLHGSSDGPGVNCIIWDRYMAFTMQIAQELEIPEIMFCPTAACAFMAISQCSELIRRGIVPLKDKSYITNGYLDTTIDWIPGMRDIRLRDLPSSIRTTDPRDYFFNYAVNAMKIALKASSIIFNTFDDLEHEVLHVIQSMFFLRVYTVGPLTLQIRPLPDNMLKSIKSSVWKEEAECLKWLDSHEATSVIYVNFGSITVITEKQLMEIAQGIANSNHPFLWVIRTDLVMGGQKNVVGQEFMDEIEGRGMVVSWCPQEEVLAHPSVGLFLTHCGWNSTLESVSFGVPMLCWPFFADQHTNCRFCCNEWGVGLEIDNNLKREEIEVLIKEAMEREKGKDMRKCAMKWKRGAEIAIEKGGSSHTNLESLIHHLLQTKR